MRSLSYLLLFMFGLVGACGLGLSVMKSQFGEVSEVSEVSEVGGGVSKVQNDGSP